MKITEIPVAGYERVARAEDPASGLKALIAVHDTTLGPALGGLRMWPFRSWEEAQFDVLRLAKGMTYKSAVADTGLGGGKSIILGNPKTEKSEALFRAMGRFIDAFGGRYITAEDVGTSVEDMVTVRKETKWVTGLPRSLGSSGDPSPWTALGCFLGVKACLEEVFGNADLAGKTVAIQGMGHVGDLPRRAPRSRSGAHLVVSDLTAERAKEAAARFGATPVAPDAIYDVPCDVFAPCALGAVINDETLRRLKTKIVAGAANNVLLREEHGDRLKRDGHPVRARLRHQRGRHHQRLDRGRAGRLRRGPLAPQGREHLRRPEDRLPHREGQGRQHEPRQQPPRRGAPREGPQDVARPYSGLSSPVAVAMARESVRPPRTSAIQTAPM